MSKTLESLPVLCCGCSSRGFSIGTRRRDSRTVFSLTSAKWTAQPLRKTSPWNTASRFLLRARDRIFGYEFVQQLTAMGVATCLDHVIVFNEAILAGETSRHLQSFGSWIIAAETTRA